MNLLLLAMFKTNQPKETMNKEYLCEDHIKELNFVSSDTKIIKVEDRKCDECNIDDMMESFNFED